MSEFFKSKTCIDGSFCQICRTSREFRIELSKRFDDIKTIDFVCPKNKPIIVPSFPSTMRQLKNVFNSTAKVVHSVLIKRQNPIVTKEESSMRLMICKKCDYVRETKFGLRCSECGCFSGLKDILKTEHCPKKKW